MKLFLLRILAKLAMKLIEPGYVLRIRRENYGYYNPDDSSWLQNLMQKEGTASSTIE